MCFGERSRSRPSLRTAWIVCHNYVASQPPGLYAFHIQETVPTVSLTYVVDCFKTSHQNGLCRLIMATVNCSSSISKHKRQGHCTVVHGLGGVETLPASA
jgi:hypothetical protein